MSRSVLTLRCVQVGDKWSFRDSSGKEWLRLSEITNPNAYPFENGKYYEMAFDGIIPEGMTSHDHWCDWAHWIRKVY